MKKPRSLRKKTVLMLLPDRLARPLSDMGLFCFYAVKHLGKDFDFDIVGVPEENALPYYRGAINPLAGTQDISASIVSGNTAYFFQSLQGARRPDLVHAHDWSTYLAGAYAAAYFQVPLVVSVNSSVGFLSEQGLANVPASFLELEKIGLKESKYIIQLSHSAEQFFKKLPELAKKTTVIPYGVDPAEWAVHQPYKLPGKQKMKVAFIGPLTFLKGGAALCRAVVSEEIDLILMSEDGSGEPAVFQEMIKKVRDSKNVYIMNPLYGQEKVNFIRSLDAVIIPSVYEPFGITALEAFASDTLVLASFKGGLSEFLTHESAIDCGSTPDSIERAFKKLLAMSAEEKAERIAKGRKIADEYTWEQILENLKLLYQEALQ